MAYSAKGLAADQPRNHLFHAIKQGAKAVPAVQMEAMEEGTVLQETAEPTAVAVAAVVALQVHAEAMAQSAYSGPDVQGLSPPLERRTNNGTVYSCRRQQARRESNSW